MTNRQRQRNPPLFVPFPEAKCAAPFAQLQAVKFQIYEIPDPAAGVQKQVEDGVGTHVLPKFDLPQQAANVLPLHALGGKLLPLQFLHRLDDVGWHVALVNQPPEEAA